MRDGVLFQLGWHIHIVVGIIVSFVGFASRNLSSDSGLHVENVLKMSSIHGLHACSQTNIPFIVSWASLKWTAGVEDY